MMRRQLEAWNRLIRGRIAREKGRGEYVLREFEQAIGRNDRCFPDVRKIAHDVSYRNLSSVEQHLLKRVQGYEWLAETVSSRQDEPIEGLKRILAELEGRTPFDGYVKTYNGALHW